MQKRPWYKCHWSEYHADDKLQQCDAHALAMWYDVRGFMLYNGLTRIKNDLKTISKTTHLGTKSARSGVATLLKLGIFKTDSEGFIFCPRILKDSEISEIRSKAVRSRHEKQEDFVVQNVSQNTLQNSDSDSTCSYFSTRSLQGGAGGKTTKTVSEPPPEVSDGFRSFFGAYPKPVAMREAQEAWVQVTCRAPESKRAKPADILAGLVRQKAEGYFPDDPRYIPNPAKYLLGWRWEDRTPVRPPQTAATGLSGDFRPGFIRESCPPMEELPEGYFDDVPAGEAKGGGDCEEN